MEYKKLLATIAKDIKSQNPSRRIIPHLEDYQMMVFSVYKKIKYVIRVEDRNVRLCVFIKSKRGYVPIKEDIKGEIGFYQYQNIIEFMSAIGYPKFKAEYLQLKDIISKNVDILKPTLPKVNPIDLMWQIDEMRGLTK